MTNEDYIKKLSRLKEIEDMVKKPEFSLDNIDSLIEETKVIAAECYAYTRGLKAKVGQLDELIS